MKNWILRLLFPEVVKANRDRQQCAETWRIERELLTKQLEHAQKLNLTLAEKITLRTTITPIATQPAEKTQAGTQGGGHISWTRTRDRLEAGSQQN